MPGRPIQPLAAGSGRSRRRLRAASRRRARTPTILQMEALECGAACLAVVLAYFGRWVPLEELRVACGVSRDGSRASSLWQAAKSYGLTVEAFSAEPRDLGRFRPPMILHWSFNHFVVLEGLGKGKAFLNDPATGRRVVSRQELDESFTGVVLTFGRGPEFVKRGRRPGLLGGLRPRLRGTWAPLTFAMLAGLLLMVPRLLRPFFSRVFVEEILLRHAGDVMPPLLLAMSAAVLVLGLLTWLQLNCLARLEAWLSVSGSTRLFWHILHLPVEYFGQRFAGDIASRLSVVSRIAETLSRELATNALSAIMVLAFGGLMFRLSPMLAAIGLSVVSLNLVALQAFSRRRGDGNRRLLREEGRLQGAILGGLEMIETIKATGAEMDLMSRWTGCQAKIMNTGQVLERQSLQLEAVPPLLAALSTAAVLAIGSLQVIDGSLTLGGLVAFQILLAVSLAPVSRLVSLGARMQIAAGDMNRVDDVLRCARDGSLQETLEPAGALRLDEERLSGTLEIRAVAFGYNRLAPPLIQDFNLRLRPGDRVALVGPSGTGKSTLARLVAGLFTPWSGEIVFDGRRRTELSRAVLSGAVAYVDQTITLFEGSVRDNLTLWDPTVPLADLVAAAQDAALHEEIMARPGGYDGPVEEGGRNWSGGQRQRLEIARALVSHPTLLVLDEATSALDPATEQIIDANLRRRGCTCLIIAHRLSTIRDADEILVLDGGRIVQRGTHEQLRERPGLYRRLVELG